MVSTNDKKLFEKIKNLKSQAVSKDRNYYHDEIGFNFRMTKLQLQLELRN